MNILAVDGRKCQIWITISHFSTTDNALFEVHAWDYEKRHVYDPVTLSDLEKCLDETLSKVNGWHSAR